MAAKKTDTDRLAKLLASAVADVWLFRQAGPDTLRHCHGVTWQAIAEKLLERGVSLPPPQ